MALLFTYDITGGKVPTAPRCTVCVILKTTIEAVVIHRNDKGGNQNQERFAGFFDKEFLVFIAGSY